MEFTSSTLYFKMLFKALKMLNIDKQHFMEYYEPDANKRVSHLHRVPTEQVAKALNAAAVLSGHNDLAIVMGANIHQADYGMMSYVLMNCTDIRQMLELVCEYKPLLNEAFSATLEHRSGEYIYTLESMRLADSRLVEFDFSSIIRLGRFFSREVDNGLSAHLSRVEFTHYPFAPISSYEQYFDCPVLFGQSQNRIVIPEAVMDIPVVSSNPEIREEMLKVIDNMMAMEVNDQLIGHVKLFVYQSLSQNERPGLAETARHFGFSVSTFKRELARYDTSYSAVCAEVLMHRAEELLKNGSLSILEISSILGFSSSSSFHRAFKRWKGESPRRFVARMPVEVPPAISGLQHR